MELAEIAAGTIIEDGPGFVQSAGNVLKDKIVETGKETVALTTDAIAEVKEIVEEFVDATLQWIEDSIKWMFEQVLNPIIERLKNWVEGIETAMIEFFEAVNAFDWGEGVTEPPEGFDVTKESDNCMVKWVAFLLSYIGIRKHAEGIMNALQDILEFIQPLLNIFGGLNNAVMNIANWLSHLVGGNGACENSFINDIITFFKEGTDFLLIGFIDLIFGESNSFVSLFGLNEIYIFKADDYYIPSFQAVINFLSSLGFDFENFILWSAIERLIEIWGEPHFSTFRLLVITSLLMSLALGFVWFSLAYGGRLATYFTKISDEVDGLLNLLIETVCLIISVIAISEEAGFFPALFAFYGLSLFTLLYSGESLFNLASIWMQGTLIVLAVIIIYSLNFLAVLELGKQG